MAKRKKEYRVGVCPECKVREGDSSKKRLYKCPYCGRYFCEKHLEPRLATTRSSIESIKDPVLREKVYEEWRKPDGHPDWVWTRQYFENLERKEKEEREKALKMLDELKESGKEEPTPMKEVESEYVPAVPTTWTERTKPFVLSSESSFSKEVKNPEIIDPLVWIGLFVSLVSLFLPWVSANLFGFPMESTWFGLFQVELQKIEQGGLLNYIMTSHYAVRAISILPLIGFAVVFIGLLARKNCVIFGGSIFMLFSPLTFLFFLSQGVSVAGTNISLISIAGIGAWGFLVGSFLSAYGSAKEMSDMKIFSSLVLVAIVVVIILSKPSLLFLFKLG